MIEFVKNLWLNPINPYVALFLYYIPTATSLIYWISEVVKQYIREQKEYHEALEKGENFYAELSVGHIIGLIIISFIPVVNIFVMLFRFLPVIVSRIYTTCSKFFDIKLVPNNKVPPKDYSKK